MAYDLNNTRLFFGTIVGAEIGGHKVGWVGEQVSISRESSTLKIGGGNSLTAADELFLEKNYKVSFSLREVSLKNLAIALGVPASALAVNESSLEGETSQPEEVVLKFEFLNHVNSKYMLFIVPRARISGSGTAALSAGTQGDLAVEFSMLDDGTGRAFAATESNTSTWA